MTPNLTKLKNYDKIKGDIMVKIYSTITCLYCHALMDWFDEEGIKYQEIDASTVPGITAVPVTEINGQRIVGFDRVAIRSALATTDNSQV